MRHLFYCLLVVVVCGMSFLSFADHEASLRPTVTDRPDAAEATAVMGKNHFQIETSFGFASDHVEGVTTRTYSFPTLFRYGVTDRLELRLEGEMFAWQTVTGASTENGFTDLALGTKIFCIDQKGAAPSLSFLGAMNIPTGKSSFSSQVAEPIAKLLADWELPKDFGLGTNWGIDVPVRDAQGNKFARFLYAIALGHPMPWIKDRWAFFIEFAGAIPLAANKPDEHSFDTGFTFDINPDIQLDTLVRIGMTPSTPDITAALGLSWRFL